MNLTEEVPYLSYLKDPLREKLRIDEPIQNRELAIPKEDDKDSKRCYRCNRSQPLSLYRKRKNELNKACNTCLDNQKVYLTRWKERNIKS